MSWPPPWPRGPRGAVVDDALALRILRHLVGRQPGALRIITARPSDKGEAWLEHMALGRPALAAQLPDPTYSNPQADPALWVVHDVVRLEGPDREGYYQAISAQGDRCKGAPLALLRRLTEATRDDQRGQQGR